MTLQVTNLVGFGGRQLIAKLSTPTSVVNATLNQSTATSLTSGSATPSNNTLIVAICPFMNWATAITSCTFSDSAGGSWTTRVSAFGGGYEMSAAIGTCEVTTGTSRTFTATWNQNAYSADLQIYEFTGYDTASPFGATASATGSGNTGSLSQSLSATSAATSNVMATACVDDNLGGDANNVDTGSGWTQLREVTTNVIHHAEYIVAAKTAIEWDEIVSTSGSHAVAGLEIKSAFG